MKPLTFRAALLWGLRLLREANVPDAHISARILLQSAASLSHQELVALLPKPILPHILEYYRFLLKRRQKHEPLPYITGYYPFMDFHLLIRRGVFIPRPETETLVEVAEKQLKDKEGIVIDVGTGSGAIAIALARLCPKLSIIGIDISKEAIALARINARFNKVSDRVVFKRGDIRDMELPKAIGVVSNPPYIPTSLLPSLPLEIRLYEPIRALDGGKDGLEVIREIVRRASDILLSGGYLILEIGEGQSQAVRELFYENGFKEVEVFKDLGKIDRVILGVKM
jgi:release factor glutamine methyltransferase